MNRKGNPIRVFVAKADEAERQWGDMQQHHDIEGHRHTGNREEHRSKVDKFSEADEEEDLLTSSDILDLKISDLLSMKLSTKEIYGLRISKKSFGREISNFLNDIVSHKKQVKERPINRVEGASPSHPIMVPSEEKQGVTTRSFKSALIGEEVNHGRSLKQTVSPRREGDNAVVELDIEEYKKGIDDLKFSIVGKLSM